jgi:hypothetical protein
VDASQIAAWTGLVNALGILLASVASIIAAVQARRGAAQGHENRQAIADLHECVDQIRGQVAQDRRSDAAPIDTKEKV